MNRKSSCGYATHFFNTFFVLLPKRAFTNLQKRSYMTPFSINFMRKNGKNSLRSKKFNTADFLKISKALKEPIIN
jgi:hypothetical protein